MGTYTRPFDTPPVRFGEVPRSQGLVFVCFHCTRPHAVMRDDALKLWGELGIIADVARRIRCSNCRKRGGSILLAPAKVKFGSKDEIEKFLDALGALPVRGPVK